MTMAKTTATGLEHVQWQAQAIVLAEEAHLIHRARFLGDAVFAESLWEVPSKTTEGSVYVVHMWPATIGAACSCLAMSLGYGRACSHAGAALIAERQKQAAERSSEGDTALRWFAHGGEW